ncbi:MAG: hypothetical protein P9M15_07480 [Candidatus Electryoneaceae bacterium]|nr:hypothetical protein [Candidatus Electryoneaceae bacterium]
MSIIFCYRSEGIAVFCLRERSVAISLDYLWGLLRHFVPRIDRKKRSSQRQEETFLAKTGRNVPRIDVPLSSRA